VSVLPPLRARNSPPAETLIARSSLTLNHPAPTLNLSMSAQSPIPYIWQYIPLALQVVAAIAVAGGMVAVSYFIGKHKRSRVKLEPYECGMDPVGDARSRFSVRFYMVAMLFILFDVEAVFMLPWAVIYRKLPAITGSRMFGFWEMLVYLGFVAVGLFYVWKKGILNWSSDKADL
jgi:NADH-quinone oxidoreductase subunit A